ncbi:MAG: hypothetical protein ACFE0I_17705 [Elainellaceae cyanobacterium]
MPPRCIFTLLLTLFIALPTSLGVFVGSAQAELLHENQVSLDLIDTVLPHEPLIIPESVPVALAAQSIQMFRQPTIATTSKLERSLIDLWTTARPAFQWIRQLLWMFTRQWYALMVTGSAFHMEKLSVDHQDDDGSVTDMVAVQ